MRGKRGIRAARGRERGATLVLVGVSLLAMLSVAALAIDLGLLYVARNEAQRAADAAALAGAYTFVTSGCTSHGGCAAGGPQEPLARQQAELIGAQNAIVGQPTQIKNSDISFKYPSAEEPQITVTVQRTRASGNPIPTIFAKMFGMSEAGVTATATAEAYNPSGSSGTPGFGNDCVAPFLVPNCDPTHTSPENSNCPGNGYFIDPKTGQIENGSSPNSVIGQSWQLHYGSSGPSNGAVPSQWYLYATAGSQSGSNLRNYISQCSPVTINCGDTLQTYNGKSNGPVDQGVEDRIHAGGLGMDQGQDTIDTSLGPPFPITGGVNNPDSSVAGQTYGGPSDSVVTVPIYKGQSLSAGGSSVTVIGFMQLFLQDVEHSGTSDYVNAVIMNVAGCPLSMTSGSGSSGSNVVSTGGAPIAIRLIHQ